MSVADAIAQHLRSQAAIRPAGLPGFEDAPENLVPCCYGSANNGPRGCTCWEAIFDLEQEPVQEGPMELRAKCCHDCAYRQGSPERQAGEGEFLEDCADSAHRHFCCHQGVRRIVGWRHPIIGELPAELVDDGNYQPPMRGDRIWRADGRPGEFCAGWGATGARR